jgi:hypothetical protein
MKRSTYRSVLFDTLQDDQEVDSELPHWVDTDDILGALDISEGAAYRGDLGRGSDGEP